MIWLRQNLKIAIGALGLAAIVLFFILRGEAGPESAIHQRLDELCDMVSYQERAPQLQQITTAKKLSGMFVAKPYLVPWPGRSAVTDQNAVTGLFVYLLKYASEAEVSITNRQITLDANGVGATVTATVTGKATVNGNTERHSGRYRIELDKIDGEWLIATAEPLD